MTTFFPFIEPQTCFKRAIRPTLRNVLGQHVMATRKEFDPFHEIVYRYDEGKGAALSARQFKIIDNHCASMDGGVTSFYVVDWGDMKHVKAIDKKGYITLHNTKNLSTNYGAGGKNIIIWSMTGDYGNDSTVTGNPNPSLTQLGKNWTPGQWFKYKLMDTDGHVFNATTILVRNTADTIYLNANATPHAGAYEIFRYESHVCSIINEKTRVVTVNASIVIASSWSNEWEQVVMPVYRCFYAADSLGLEPTGEFNRESSDNFGQFYAGEINFIQKGTN